MLLIALGANLPGPAGDAPLVTCLDALAQLNAIGGLEFVAISSWYRTRPVPHDANQPDYCNGVARFRGMPDAATLLAQLHRIEADLGRQRTTPNAARTIDLDLIDLNGMIRDAPPPILPHPRAHLRRFVLRPILDVAPDWLHPVTHQPVATLLASLPPADAASLTRW